VSTVAIARVAKGTLPFNGQLYPLQPTTRQEVLGDTLKPTEMLPVHGTTFSAKHKDMVDAAMAKFKANNTAPPAPGPCCFTDSRVRENVYPYVLQARDDICIAICRNHHTVHVCTASCRSVTQMDPEDDSTYVCDITLMPRPRAGIPQNRQTYRESAIDKYRAKHLITHPLIVRADQCSQVSCQRWYAIEDSDTGLQFICMEHNVLHCCGDNACETVNGRCPISGIAGQMTAEFHGDEMDETHEDACVAAAAAACDDVVAVKHRQKHVQTVKKARATITVVANRIFRLREVQERIDNWCEFVYEFLKTIGCIEMSNVEIYACAVFQLCFDEGLVIRSMRCLPEKACKYLPNIRTIIPEKTSVATKDIMLKARDQLPQLVKLYKKYFKDG
jgi:hypothetical protein